MRRCRSKGKPRRKLPPASCTCSCWALGSLSIWEKPREGVSSCPGSASQTPWASGPRAESPGLAGGGRPKARGQTPRALPRLASPGLWGSPFTSTESVGLAGPAGPFTALALGGGGSRLVASRGEAKREAERRRPPCGTLRPWRRWVSFGGRRTQLLHPRPGSLTCCGRAGSSEPKNRPRGHLSPRAESLASPLRGQGTVKANLLVPGAPRKCPGHKAPL